MYMIFAANRADFTLSKKPRQWNLTNRLFYNPSIMIGFRKQSGTTAITGKY
jgi:hypothetical protein